jgi:hypothetical protein
MNMSLAATRACRFERTVAGKRVVNAGGVGMPYEDRPSAYWTLDLVHRCTPYDGSARCQPRGDDRPLRGVPALDGNVVHGGRDHMLSRSML